MGVTSKVVPDVCLWEFGDSSDTMVELSPIKTKEDREKVEVISQELREGWYLGCHWCHFQQTDGLCLPATRQPRSRTSGYENDAHNVYGKETDR